MSDSYLAISQIADNDAMRGRVNAAVAQMSQQEEITLVTGSMYWVEQHRYAWAATSGWGEAWAKAQTEHRDEVLLGKEYDPGQDESVITDDMIRTTICNLVNE